jgi:hypothetical protein
MRRTGTAQFSNSRLRLLLDTGQITETDYDAQRMEV